MTSSDEVSNKLSAQNNYNFIVTETFDADNSTDLIPGSEVNKDVAVTNVGNIAGYTEVILTGKITPTVKSATKLAYNGDTTNAKLLPVDEKYVEALEATVGEDEEKTSLYTKLTSENATLTGLDGYTFYVKKLGKDTAGKDTFEVRAYFTKGDANYAVEVEEGVVSLDAEGKFTVDTSKVQLPTVETKDEIGPNQLDYTLVKKDNNKWVNATNFTDATALKISDSSEKYVFYAVFDATGKGDWFNESSEYDKNEFIYSKLVESGETTANLVDCVVMGDTEEADYVTLNFELIVKANSVQAILDGDTYLGDGIEEKFEVTNAVIDNTTNKGNITSFTGSVKGTA